MTSFDVRDMLRADAEGGQGDRPSPRARKEIVLSPLAEKIAAEPHRPRLSTAMLGGILRTLEFALVTATGAAMYYGYLARHVGIDAEYVVGIPLLAVLNAMIFQALGAYEFGRLRYFTKQAARVIAGWALTFLIASALIFFGKFGEHFSRVWLAGWFGLGLVGLIAMRLAVGVYVHRMTKAGRLTRRAVLVGGGEAGENLLRAIDRQPDSGIKICGVFDDRADNRSPDLVAGYPKLGTVDDLVEFARRASLDLIIFTLPISAEGRILQMLRKLWVLPIDIRLSAHSSKLKLRPRAYSYIGSVPVLDVFDRPLADWDLVMKAAFDRVVGALMLILLSPVMLLTALAVKLDSKGPVFFRQKRYGFNNDLIEVFKFRSMYVDQADATASKLATKNDPRVTRVGRIIRKTSLDELPQLFNVVFKGNLSLVGPRPHAVHAKAQNRLYDQVVDGYFARHKVKPGITGWAQVNGWRGETDTEDKIQRRVEHDLFYIENWSILFDAWILAMTPFALLKTENAY